MSEELIREAVEKDLNQSFINALTPDRGYDEVPIDNTLALFNQLRADLADTRQKLAEAQAENESVRLCGNEETRRLTKERDDLRAQRDQAVLLAIEAREALKHAMVIDFSSNPEKRKPCDVALAKLQSLNPPTSDDTLKV